MSDPRTDFMMIAKLIDPDIAENRAWQLCLDGDITIAEFALFVTMVVLALSPANLPMLRGPLERLTKRYPRSKKLAKCLELAMINGARITKASMTLAEQATAGASMKSQAGRNLVASAQLKAAKTVLGV